MPHSSDNASFFRQCDHFRKCLITQTMPHTSDNNCACIHYSPFPHFVTASRHLCYMMLMLPHDHTITYHMLCTTIQLTTPLLYDGHAPM
eukprot:1159376-Pelagomonas_calceolata.AAC.2